MDKVIRGLRGTVQDAIFVGHNVFAAAIRELRVTMIEDVKVASNKGDANCAYSSLIQVNRLGFSDSIQENFDALVLKRLMLST